MPVMVELAWFSRGTRFEPFRGNKQKPGTSPVRAQLAQCGSFNFLNPLICRVVSSSGRLRRAQHVGAEPLGLTVPSNLLAMPTRSLNSSGPAPASALSGQADATSRHFPLTL
jgi:hypothetical protein